MASAPVDIEVVVKGLASIKKLEKQMEAIEKDVAKLNRTLPAASNNVRKFGASAKAAAAGGRAMTAAFAKVAALIGTVSAAVGSFNVAVARTESERRISILADAYGEAAQLAAVAARSAEKFGQSQTEANNALATTYARLRPVGVGLADIESIYGGFNTAARLAGANAQESAGAFRQLAQALGSGALRGDEFNSIAEQAPLVLQAVAAETGLAIGELRDFAATGGITSDIVIKALKRIEKEGADQLAESLKGPQQAIRNFQNSFEDLGASLGKLAEPQLIAFFNGLSAGIDAVVANMDKIAKTFEAAFDVIIKPFQALAAGIAETGPKFDGFGKNAMEIWGALIKLLEDTTNNILVPVFNVIGKILGTAIKWFVEFAKGVASAMSGAAGAVVEAIRIMADAIARFINATPAGLFAKVFGVDLGNFATGPLNALANGIDNVGSSVTGYVETLKAAGREFAAATPQGAGTDTGPLSQSTFRPPTPGGGTAPGGGTNDAAQKAQQIQQQLLASEKLITAAQREKDLAAAVTEEQKAQIESRNRIFEIAEKYGELAAKSLSEAETENLLKAQGLEVQNERVALEEKLADIEKQRFGGIDEEIAHMEAILAGTEEEYLLRKKIAELGGGPEAEAKVRRADELEKEVEAYKKLEAQVDQVASTIAGEMTNAFTSIIDGSKSAEEAMADMLKGIGESFIQMAMEIIQEQIKMIIYGMIMKALGITMPGAGGGGLGGSSGGWTLPGGAVPKTSGMSFFAGGGYTGDAPRSGGIDGKGGFPAILHPQETVVDHAMGRYSPGNNAGGKAGSSEEGAGGAGGGGEQTFRLETTVINNVEYATVDQVQAMGSAAARQGAKGGEAMALRKLQMSPAARRRTGL